MTYFFRIRNFCPDQDPEPDPAFKLLKIVMKLKFSWQRPGSAFFYSGSGSGSGFKNNYGSGSGLKGWINIRPDPRPCRQCLQVCQSVDHCFSFVCQFLVAFQKYFDTWSQINDQGKESFKRDILLLIAEKNCLVSFVSRLPSYCAFLTRILMSLDTFKWF